MGNDISFHLHISDTALYHWQQVLEYQRIGEVWNTQYFSPTVCQISQRYDNLNCRSRGFETSRDLTIRRLIGYWNGPCFLHNTPHVYPSYLRQYVDTPSIALTTEHMLYACLPLNNLFLCVKITMLPMLTFCPGSIWSPLDYRSNTVKYHRHESNAASVKSEGKSITWQSQRNRPRSSRACRYQKCHQRG